MRLFLRKTFLLSGIVVFFMAMPAFVFAQEVGGVYRVLGLPAASNALLVMRIMQIVWFLLAAGSLAFAGYGFYLMRSASEDLFKADQGKRFFRYGLIVGGISLAIAIILSVVFAQMVDRASGTTPLTPVGSGQTTTLSTSFLGSFSNIVSHYPARDEKNIARNVSVLITFSKPIDGKSVFDTSGALLADRVTIKTTEATAKAIEASVELDSSKKILKITPRAFLGDGAKPIAYQASVSPKILFENGESVLGGSGYYTWHFEVSAKVDVMPPSVLGVFPVAGGAATRVAKNALIQVNFSEGVDPSLLGSGKIEVLKKSTNTPIEGAWSLGNAYKTLTFFPKEQCGVNSCSLPVYCLPASSDVRVVIKAATLAEPRNPDNFNRAKFPYDGAVDLAGNSLDGGGERGLKKNGKSDGKEIDDYTWAFSTSDTLNVEVPRITSLTPGRNAGKVDINAPVHVEFSSLMDATSLTPISVTLGQDLNYWLSTSDDYQKNTTSVDIFHDAFKASTVYRPVVSSEAQTVYQQCFSSCSGPTQ